MALIASGRQNTGVRPEVSRDGQDLQPEVLEVMEAERHALDHLDLVVDSFGEAVRHPVDEILED